MSSTAAPESSDLLDRAVSAVRQRTDVRPRVALVLGSGLGALAEEAAGTVAVAAAEIPGYPVSTVEGHHGRLVFGTVGDLPVVFVQGRVHLYESYTVDQLTFPVRLVQALGAERLLVTNSAGGINRTFTPGTLMFITDHLRFAQAAPAGRGATTRDAAGDAPANADPANADPANADPANERSAAYDPAWTDAAEQVALDLGVRTRRGTYVWVRGPSYETKAEIRAFERLGADAVGMSTVPEVIQARRLGMRVLGISTITNPAAGMGAETLDHDDVLAVGQQVRGDLTRLVRGILAGIA